MTAKFKRVVKSAFARPRVMSAHPEADVLAAFAENALLPLERATVVAHLADCADCRESLVLAFPADAEEKSALPKPRAAWRWSPAWNWAASMAVICIVVSAVWEFRGQRVVAPAKPAEAPIAIQAPKLAAEPETAPARPVVAKHLRQFTPPPMAAPLAKKAPAPPPPPPPVLATPQQTPPQPAADAGSAGALVSARASPPAADTLQPSSQAVEVRQSAPVAKMQSASHFGAMGAAGRVTRPAVLWSIGGESRGVLQRSDDGGATWTVVTLAGEVSFRAVTSTGNDVWVGGSAGALFHSGDQGAHWQRVETNTTGTIVGIRAGASGEAVVTTDDGRTWKVKATQP
jgi:hypothetical protein